jgi:cytochrome c-type biogenesis protein CcmH/NrfG
MDQSPSPDVTGLLVRMTVRSGSPNMKRRVKKLLTKISSLDMEYLYRW